MICYKSMTFCSGDGCSKFGPCFRSLTPEVREAANAAGLEIARHLDPKSEPCWTAHDMFAEKDETPSLF
jgi:hypothetical protein